MTVKAYPLATGSGPRGAGADIRARFAIDMEHDEGEA